MAVSAGQIVIGVRARLNEFDSAMKKVDRSLARLQRKTDQIAQTLQRNVALPLIAVGGAATKAFADFDQGMTQSLAIMGDVSDAMRNDMANAAKEVAKTTTVSASQAAESYYFLASAGLDASQSIKALPQVAAFAQAGMFDMSTATDLATDAQTALGLASSDAQENLENLTRVTDVLVKANVIANASTQQFSEALTNGAGIALKDVGKSIEEGTAVLAAFASQGIKGAEAGTAFGIVMRDLQTKTIKNKDAMRELGIAVFDQNGEMRNLAAIVRDIENALEGMSDEQRKATLLSVGFSDKSVKYVSSLLGMSDAIVDYEDKLKKAGGTTKEVAEKQLNSFSSKLKLLRNQLENVGIELGEIVADKLTPFLAQVSELIARFDKLDPKTKAAIVDFALWAVKITAAATAIAAATKVIRIATTATNAWSLAIGTVIVKWDKFQTFFEQSQRSFAENLKILEAEGNKKALSNLFEIPAKVAKAYFPDTVKRLKQLSVEMKKVGGQALDTAKSVGSDLWDAFRKANGNKNGGGGDDDGANGLTDKLKALREELKELDREANQARIGDNIARAIGDLDPNAFRKYADELYKATYDSTLAGIEEGLRGTPEAQEIAKKNATAAVSDAAKEWGEAVNAANASAVDQWRGLMEDAITGTRFDIEAQLSKALTNVASKFLSDMLGGVDKLSTEIAEGIGKSLNIELKGAGLEAVSGVVTAGISTAISATVSAFRRGITGLTDSSGGNDLESGIRLFNPFAITDEITGIDTSAILADFVSDIFEDNGDAQAEARKGIEGFLEEIFGADIVFGDRGRFEDNWVEQFDNIAGSGVGAFSAIGEAITQLAGVSEPIGAQIGFILAENLNGNLNDAKLLIEQLGISLPELQDQLLQAGIQGEKSWHEVTVALNELNKLQEKGRVGVGDYIGAFEDLIASGGYGLVAIRNVQNLSIEAAEAGARSLDDLQRMLVDSGRFTEDQIAQLFQVLEGRGITSLEELENASDITLGGIVADLESAGFAWSDMTENIATAAQQVTELQSAVQGLQDKTVDVKVRVRYETVNSPPAGVEGVTPDVPTSVDTRSTTASAKSLGATINIDARGADAGVEQRLLSAMRSLEDNAVRKSLAVMQNERYRNGY